MVPRQFKCCWDNCISTCNKVEFLSHTINNTKTLTQNEIINLIARAKTIQLLGENVSEFSWC